VRQQDGSFDDDPLAAPFGREWAQDLLRPPPPEAQQSFEHTALYPGERRCLKRSQGLRQTVQPTGFVGHKKREIPLL
jgi:hypothetical protein